MFLHQSDPQPFGAPHIAPLAASTPASSAASNQVPATAFKIHAKSQKKFWVRVLVRPQATLAVLDVFLRDIWMEPCCNHLSTFMVGNTIFCDEEGVATGMGDADMGSARLMDCLRIGLKFKYVYDMGSSTIVELKVEDEVVYPGDLCYHTQWEDDPYMQSLSSTDPGAMIRVQPLPLKVAGRNRNPKYMCANCERPATLVCPACTDTYWQDFGDSMSFCCDAHIEDHRSTCEEKGGMLRPVANSPRMGECGYRC
uniref:Uncharacterized protein n=1 Tax=Dunaliella tertiolecta TaxID=3047 RepID=A0A7S3QRZ1_DUNTE